MDVKVCSKCKELKSESEFYTHNSKTGLASACKVCTKLKYDERKEAARAYAKAYRYRQNEMIFKEPKEKRTKERLKEEPMEMTQNTKEYLMRRYPTVMTRENILKELPINSNCFTHHFTSTPLSTERVIRIAEGLQW